MLRYFTVRSNGVIIITTKRKAELKVELQWKSSSFEVTNKVDALSSTQFKDFVTAIPLLK
jgi:iron complex outermembrane receptor protein